VTDAASEPGRGGTGTEAAIVIVGALVASIAWTWPLVLHLDHAGRALIDAPFEAWAVDWVQYAIRHQPLHLYDANTFAPTKGTLAFSAPLIGVAIPLLPFRWLGFSPYSVYNIGIILATASSAIGAYVFGRQVLRDRAAAAVVGFAFAFGRFPYEKSQLQITARAGIPLAAAATWWLLDRAEQNERLRGPVIALLATLAWQTSVSMYPAVYALTAMAAVMAVRWRVVRRRPITLAAAAGGVASVLVVAIPHIRVALAYPEADRRVPGNYGIDVFGHSFPGVALTVLAIVGIVCARRARTQVIVLGGVLTILGLLMGIGTATHGWRAYMPYRVMWDLVPGIGSLRDFSRAWLLGILGLGLLSGCAVAWIRNRNALVGMIVAIVACVAIFGEGAHLWNDKTVFQPHPVDQVLANLPDPGGVLYLPIASPARNDDTLVFFGQPAIMYRTTAHHRPTVNAYPEFFPPWAGESDDLAHQLPCSFAAFWNKGIRFVVLNEHPGAWIPLQDPARAAPLRLVGTYEGDTLYKIPDPAVTPLPATCRPGVR
jgi:hypothetical protein